MLCLSLCLRLYALAMLEFSLANTMSSSTMAVVYIILLFEL